MFVILQIAQVHRATLKDRREVVVKVQHDDIKEIILEVLLLCFIINRGFVSFDRCWQSLHNSCCPTGLKECKSNS